MASFPTDFLEPDGRFRAALPGDFVPVLYLARDGSWLCARCLNELPRGLDPRTTDDPAWRIVDTALLYEGPEAVCDECGAVVAALHGDPGAPDGA